MDHTTGSESRRSQTAKSASAFRTISEVSDELDVPQHVLRFWETKFTHIKPMKRGGGRRYYRPEDLALLRRIRELLYVEGYTIKGVQRLLRQSGIKAVLAGQDDDSVTDAKDTSEIGAGAAEAVAVSAGSSVRISARSPEPAAPPPPPPPMGLDRETREALRAVLAELTALRDMLPRSGG
jgi:DNA-binding transcriptional MerR regulator